MALKKPQRTYDNLLMLLCMANVPWEEARQIAREFAAKPMTERERAEQQSEVAVA